MALVLEQTFNGTGEFLNYLPHLKINHWSIGIYSVSFNSGKKIYIVALEWQVPSRKCSMDLETLIILSTYEDDSYIFWKFMFIAFHYHYQLITSQYIHCYKFPSLPPCDLLAHSKWGKEYNGTMPVNVASN